MRGNRQLKKQALASLAGVSLSTVERIERGEPVTPDLIDRVGQVLGYEPGYLTAPRAPLDPQTAIEGFVEAYEHLQPVTVAPIRTTPKSGRWPTVTPIFPSRRKTIKNNGTH